MEAVPLNWKKKTYVMGIINATEDSFSGDGVGRSVDVAVRQAIKFVEEGADILDIGGESTRPGSVQISLEEEMERVIPVIKAVRDAVDVPISVDTYKAGVAEAALTAGADWVNDVWGLRMDSHMARVVADAGCPVVLMHNRSTPKNVEQRETLGGRFVGVEYEDLIEDVKRELMHSVKLAVDAGIEHNNIILDPGIGFGKTVKQNLQLVNQLDKIVELGYPVLLGSSRKSFIGYTLDLPPDDRVEGTAAAVSVGVIRGANIVRVHDVRVISRTVRMLDAIVRS